MDLKSEYYLLSQKQQYLVIACVVGIISCFLPWFTFPMVASVRGIGMNGKFSLILFGLILYFLWSRNRQESLEEALQNKMMILAGIAGLLPLYHLIFTETSEGFLFVTIIGTWGLGIYLTLAASIAIIVIIKKMEEEVVGN